MGLFAAKTTKWRRCFCKSVKGLSNLSFLTLPFPNPFLLQHPHLPRVLLLLLGKETNNLLKPNHHKALIPSCSIG